MGRKRTTRRSHGQGTVYLKNGRHSISWREHGERKYEHGFPSEDLARAALARIVNEVQQGRAGRPPDPTLIPTLAELATEWLARREHTHRAWRDDRNRWNKYLLPVFGKRRPDQVDPAAIRALVEHMLAPEPTGLGLAPNTVGNAVRLLSTFFTDLVERKLAPSNPVGALPRSTRKLYKAGDPKDTPFLKTPDEVRRVYLALGKPAKADTPARTLTRETVATAFAVGALAGLRTGEVLALEWGDVDLKAQRIHVQRQARHGQVGPLKDSESRIVPLQNSLVPILKAWKLRTGGEGQLFRPAVASRGGREDAPARFVQTHTLHAGLAAALKSCKLPNLTWYQGTRHTFASLWVLAGGSIERLRDIMGHDSVTTTERYAHLRPGHFAEADFGRLAVDLSRPAGKRASLPGANGYRMATEAGSQGSRKRAKST